MLIWIRSPNNNGSRSTKQTDPALICHTEMNHRGTRLTKWSEKVALTLINTTPSQQYWQQRNRMNLQGPQTDWDALYQAYKIAPSRFKPWTPKWLSGWIPIGAKLKKWKVSPEPEIQRYHVLRCGQNSTVQQWNAALNSLDRWLTMNHTQTDLQVGILNGLRTWHDRGAIQTTTSD
jgi:hypothetical protein